MRDSADGALDEVFPAMNETLPKELLEAEKALMDRFGHYLIVAMDGDKLYNKYNSSVAAMGMAEFVANEIRKDWE